MKTKNILLVFLAGIGLLLGSCSDDNGGETLAPLPGNWTLSKVGTLIGDRETLMDAPQNQNGCEKDFLNLNIDKSASEGDYNAILGNCILTTKTGTYDRSNNNLTLVLNGFSTTQDIVNLSLTELKLKTATGIITVYTR